MNYTSRKLNCKALIVAVFCFISILTSISFGYAYDRVYGYTSGDFGLTGGFIPELANVKKTYVLNVSPRSTYAYMSVTLSYDSLADLVYYCNEHGLSTTLAYNNANGVYVAFVQDKEFKISAGKTVSVVGCLGNSDGKVYVAEKGSTSDSTTVPSTTAPSIDKTESTETDHTYISDPSTPSSSLNELDALNRLISFTVTQIKSIQGVWRTNINMYNIQIKMRSLMWNMIDGINNVTDGVYEQVDLLTGYLPRLDDIYNRLFNIQSASWASVDVENRIYSGVAVLGSRLDTLVTNSAGIGSRLDSIINNGAVQVNTSSIDARLDKLISMYSKVNSVVLDTAAINGSKIKAAVGGELQDAIFWGVSSFSDKKFIVSDGTFTLNGGRYQIPVQPLGFTTGASVPASFNTTDTALMAGVWRTSGGSYCLSDTYNAATGEYVRRVGVVTYDGSEDWKMVAKDGCYLFYLSDPAFSHTNGNIFSMSSHFGYVPYNSAFSGNASDSAIAYNYKCTVFTGKIMVITQSPSVAAWKTWLKQQADAGTPWTVWYQDKPTTTVLDRTTIAIPEGDGIITGDYMRITGKYETYDSYTQTADIIAAINNIPPYDDTAVVGAITKLENALSKPSATVTADLTEVTVRLDTLIENSASKVENVTVNITEDNDAFNVFYITGEDGETQPVTEFAKNLSGASGKFLSVLYRLVFSDALNSADSDLGSLEDFFTSTEPEESTVTQSADSTHGEVDIWSAF